MATETMESAILMEVEAIRDNIKYIGRIALPNRVYGRLDRCLQSLSNIQKTLEEGDPDAGG